jgi:hypothetical protein
MGLLKCILKFGLLVCFITYFNHASSQNNRSDSTKIYPVTNGYELLKYFRCPESGFTERDIVYLKFYLSKDNIVQFIEAKGNNTFMNQYSEKVFKQIPVDVFKKLNITSNDTLICPIVYNCMGFDTDDKSKRKKSK